MLGRECRESGDQYGGFRRVFKEGANSARLFDDSGGARFPKFGDETVFLISGRR